MVAPVTEETATTIPVYLPEGDWIDFWDGKKWTGKQWIDIATPLDRIPVFIKADAPDHVHAL